MKILTLLLLLVSASVHAEKSFYDIKVDRRPISFHEVDCRDVDNPEGTCSRPTAWENIVIVSIQNERDRGVDGGTEYLGTEEFIFPTKLFSAAQVAKFGNNDYQSRKAAYEAAFIFDGTEVKMKNGTLARRPAETNNPVDAGHTNECEGKPGNHSHAHDGLRNDVDQAIQRLQK